MNGLRRYIQDKLISGVNIKTINEESILGSGDLTVGGGTFSGTMDDIPDGTTYVKTENNYTDADAAKVAATSGTNTGDQTSIVGITGTKSQFDTACADGNFLYVGDVTQYTDEMAQDAVGGMIDSSLVYTDATPRLSRAELTGAITATAGNNTTSLGSFTKAQLDGAVSDGNVVYVGDQGTLASAQAFITGTTTLSAATYADITGASITLAAGKWLIMANVYGYATNAAFQFSVAITDNANNIQTEGTAGAQAGGTNINQWASVSLSVIVTPVGSTTYKLRGARGNTTLTANVIIADGSGQGVVNNASSNRDTGTGIRAIRIA